MGFDTFPAVGCGVCTYCPRALHCGRYFRAVRSVKCWCGGRPPNSTKLNLIEVPEMGYEGPSCVVNARTQNSSNFAEVGRDGTSGCSRCRTGLSWK